MWPASYKFIFFSNLRFGQIWRRLRWFHHRVTKVMSRKVRQQKFNFCQKFLQKCGQIVWPASWSFSFFSTLRFDQLWRRLRWFHRRVTKVKSRLVVRQQKITFVRNFFKNEASPIYFSAAANFYFPLKISSKIRSNGVTSLIDFHFFPTWDLTKFKRDWGDFITESPKLCPV